MTDIQKVKSSLQNSGASCVLVNGNVSLQSPLPGILPLLGWLEAEPDALQSSCVADKVVGKAAALLMVLGGVSEVYAEVISAPAEECFRKNGIAFSCGTEVPSILNRDQSGMCPMEKRCMEIESPQKAYEVLKEMVQARR